MPSNTDEEQELSTLMFSNGIHFLRIIETKNGYIVKPKTLQNANKIMSPDLNHKLQTSGFSLQMPLETNAKMAIVVKKVDCYIINHTNNEVKELIKPLKTHVEVYNMPQHRIVKI